jgi:AraC family transcriptional regulator
VPRDPSWLRWRSPNRPKKRVANHIEEHLHEDISLKELAGIAQLSPYHFARAFKQPFGTPRHRYHMSLRMDRAKAMLKVPARTVTEVGMMLGFAETSSFTTSFRRSVGVTPSDYRRSVARGTHRACCFAQ